MLLSEVTEHKQRRLAVALLLLGALLATALAAATVLADEPIAPLPQAVDYDEAKARLGQRLFSDPLLSLDRTISCASCHDLAAGGDDSRPVSLGIMGRSGVVNSPTVFNARFNFRQFWNGRARDLTEQAAGPLQDPVEMGITPAELENRLNREASYRAAFTAVYGDGRISFARVLDALAEFQKALVTPDSPFDRYLRNEQPLSEQELRGYLAFKELGCVTCHNGINLGGNSYQKIGVINPYRNGTAADHDSPRGDRQALTNDPADRDLYKVPTLRNIELTAPYFHDGSRATLAKALEDMGHYNLGLKLSLAQIQDLFVFLKTLTGQRPAILQAGPDAS